MRAAEHGENRGNSLGDFLEDHPVELRTVLVLEGEPLGCILARVFERLAEDPSALAALLPEEHDLR